MDLSTDSSKMLPQDLELEKYVLGCLLMEKDCMLKAAPILKESTFYNDVNAMIYKTIYELFSSGLPTDILTVTMTLKKRELLDIVGGMLYLNKLTDRVNSTVNLELNIRFLQEIALKRDLIKLTSKVNEICYEDSTDGFDALDIIQKEFLQLTRGFDNGKTRHISEILKDAYDHLSGSMGQGGLTGAKTGFSSVDNVTGGFQPQDLIIMAARPGMGKTALVVTMARNMAVMFNQPVGIFSLEMSDRQLINRIIAGETSSYSANQLNRGAIEEYQLEHILNSTAHLSSRPIYIDDTAGMSIVTFRTKAYKLVAEFGVKCIIVDYLQLMRGENKGNREQEISEISRGLKIVAKELNIPVIALSQLSRAVESRGGDKRPMLSDLRESGAIEQDADVVIFIYRPEYYNITETESGESTKGMTEVIFAKHRSGSLETVLLNFQAKYAKFSDYNQIDIIEDLAEKPDVFKMNPSKEFSLEDPNAPF